MDARTGRDSRLSTTVSVYRDGDRLIAIFSCTDDEVVATYTERDQPLYEEDVVEIFLAPGRPQDYFEFEVSPKGVLFDARVHSPDLQRSTMEVDRSWDCDGFFAAVRTTRGGDELFTLDVVVAIPFQSLAAPAPAAGEEWLANFYRIDRSARYGDSFDAWRPTGRTPPDFHVPEAFGRLRFA